MFRYGYDPQEWSEEERRARMKLRAMLTGSPLPTELHELPEWHEPPKRRKQPKPDKRPYQPPPMVKRALSVLGVISNISALLGLMFIIYVVSLPDWY
jgi:hypothetical protein